jgi:hypothetical protein
MGYELEEIKKFIRLELKKGYAVETVRTTLMSSGFSKSEVKKAFATLGRKETKAAPVKPASKPKKKGPGMLSGWFTAKPKSKKPKIVKKPVKKVVKKVKPKPIPKPKKKGLGFFEGFFFKETKPKTVKKVEPVKKILPKPAPKPKLVKPKGPGLFSGWFTAKPKSIKPKTIVKKVVKKPIPKPKPALKPKKPGFFKRLFGKRTKNKFFGAQKSKAFPAKPKKIKIKPKIKKHRKPFKFPKIPYIKETSLITFLIVFFVII